VVGERVGHGLGVSGAVHLDNADALLACFAYAVLGEQAVAFDAVALGQGRIADLGADLGGARQVQLADCASQYAWCARKSRLLPLLRTPLLGELLALIYLHPETSYSVTELAHQLKVSERDVPKIEQIIDVAARVLDQMSPL